MLRSYAKKILLSFMEAKLVPFSPFSPLRPITYYRDGLVLLCRFPFEPKSDCVRLKFESLLEYFLLNPIFSLARNALSVSIDFWLSTRRIASSLIELRCLRKFSFTTLSSFSKGVYNG